MQGALSSRHARRMLGWRASRPSGRPRFCCKLRGSTGTVQAGSGACLPLASSAGGVAGATNVHLRCEHLHITSEATARRPRPALHTCHRREQTDIERERAGAGGRGEQCNQGCCCCRERGSDACMHAAPMGREGGVGGEQKAKRSRTCGSGGASRGGLHGGWRAGLPAHAVGWHLRMSAAAAAAAALHACRGGACTNRQAAELLQSSSSRQCKKGQGSHKFTVRCLNHLTCGSSNILR